MDHPDGISSDRLVTGCGRRWFRNLYNNENLYIVEGSSKVGGSSSTIGQCVDIWQLRPHYDYKKGNV